jgi:hypothetical protein
MTLKELLLSKHARFGLPIPPRGKRRRPVIVFD